MGEPGGLPSMGSSRSDTTEVTQQQQQQQHRSQTLCFYLLCSAHSHFLNHVIYFNSSSISPIQVRKNICPLIFFSSVDSFEFYKLLWCQKENEGRWCLCRYRGVTTISQLPQPQGDMPGPSVSGKVTRVPLPSPRQKKHQSQGITPASMKGMCSRIRSQHPRTSSQKFRLFLQT